MVFRGKPSKACERCRARRLRCDLRSGACGPCVRVKLPCSGYRDTQQLRIWDESQSVARRALKSAAPQPEPKSLPLSLDLQARDTFFAYYVASRCWDFLRPYYHPTDSPEYLTLAIEAVSLAYLWHQVDSDAALATARQKYVSALRMTNKGLKSSKEVTKDTVLMASLLLDLFEKITDSEPRNNKSWTSHVDGALALVNLRGLDQFQHPVEFSILVRLSTHYIVGCVAGVSPVPDILHRIQEFIGKRLSVKDPMLRLSNLMIQYAKLCSETKKGVLSNDEQIALSRELDVKWQALDSELPPYWQYTTKILDYKSDRAFDLHFDSYDNPRVCQARNILRVIRILLNESLIDYYRASLASDEYLPMIERARDNIKLFTREICACVPQYVDCDSAARHRLLASGNPHHTPIHRNHSHTPNHQLDCYTLIFPLYIAGRSQALPDARSWAVKRLHYISSHFYIRNAEVVAKMLERGEEAHATGPWEVYAMLGSYAFAS